MTRLGEFGRQRIMSYTIALYPAWALNNIYILHRFLDRKHRNEITMILNVGYGMPTKHQYGLTKTSAVVGDRADAKLITLIKHLRNWWYTPPADELMPEYWLTSPRIGFSWFFGQMTIKSLFLVICQNAYIAKPSKMTSRCSAHTPPWQLTTSCCACIWMRVNTADLNNGAQFLQLVCPGQIDGLPESRVEISGYATWDTLHCKTST
jgi:hypothetical protein